MKPVFWILVAALLVVRIPSLAQPAGPDQGLYTYVGQRIAGGEIPYRDAWDQKPPAIHYTYALMFALWPSESTVAAADLIVAALVAFLLIAIGAWIGDRAAPGAGGLAAVVFLLFGNPVYTRLGGVRIRSQCETFIALMVTAAVFFLLKSLAFGRDSIHERRHDNWRSSFAAGVLLGLAFTFKYNAIVYAMIVPVTLAWLARPRAIDQTGMGRRLAVCALGFVLPVVVMVMGFGWAGALGDVYEATIQYNLRYSGETYASSWDVVRYLVSFPVRHARLDSLWLLGGAGSLVLLLALAGNPALLIAPLWTALACLSIAVNGSRGLPQYFVQAAPALALAAGLGGAFVWNRMTTIARVGLILLVSIGVWRVTPFGKAVDYTVYDLNHLLGRMSRDAYLSRFGGERSPERAEKYIALDQARLGELLKLRTSPEDKILIFGFSSGAYVQSNRASASRFFWSRPVIVEFNAGKPGYGPEGLLADLRANTPRIVVLQRNDWELEGTDSAGYFLHHAALSSWLRAEYEPGGELNNYAIWVRRGAQAMESRPPFTVTPD